MMMVVADPILESCRRSGRLDAADQPLGDQQAEGVVDRLQGDGADLGPDGLGDAIGGDMGLTGHGTQDRNPLRGHLDAAFTQEDCRICRHRRRLAQILESINI